MAQKNTPVVDYLLLHPEDLLKRDVIVELFTYADRVSLTENVDHKTLTVSSPVPLYVGKLVTKNKEFFRVEAFSPLKREEENILYAVTVTNTGIKDDGELLCVPTDPVFLAPNIIPNYKDKEVLETSVGLFVLNYTLLCVPFNDLIPYQNTIWKSGKLQDKLSDLLLNKKITVDDLKKFANIQFFIGQLTEIFAPNLTPKALATSPEIPALKAKLLEENKEALAKGDSVTMARIEKTLIQADKDYIKDDPAELFLIKGKYWNVVRKKLFLTHGMVERFGEKGTFDFIPNSLEEGWTIESLPMINNETRGGSYARAMETADGGARAKAILRVFMNTRITQDDCGSKRGLPVDIWDYNHNDYVYRYHVLPNGKSEEITRENSSSFVGKCISVRSPMYCNTKDGFCYTCCGNLYRSLGQDAFATVAQSLASSFLTKALKSMHGVSVDIYEIGDLKDYVV